MADYRSGFGGNKGAARGAKIGAIYGEWTTNRNPGHFQGAFNNFQKEMVAINRARAAEFQANVVQNIKERTLRKTASTGRLIEVTASKKNVSFANAKGGQTFSTFGWYVGMTDYLDHSIAKYWRTIEEGSKAVWREPFVGLKFRKDGVTPLWGSFGRGAVAQGARTFATGPFSTPKKGATGGKFRPFYPPKQGGGTPDFYAEGGGAKFQLRVGHEIAPMDAYLDAWRKGGFGTRAKQDWKVAWEASFGRIPTTKDRELNTPRLPKKG
jgi:hypothetical protein